MIENDLIISAFTERLNNDFKNNKIGIHLIDPHTMSSSGPALIYCAYFIVNKVYFDFKIQILCTTELHPKINPIELKDLNQDDRDLILISNQLGNFLQSFTPYGLIGSLYDNWTNFFEFKVERPNCYGTVVSIGPSKKMFNKSYQV